MRQICGKRNNDDTIKVVPMMMTESHTQQNYTHITPRHPHRLNWHNCVCVFFVLLFHLDFFDDDIPRKAFFRRQLPRNSLYPRHNSSLSTSHGLLRTGRGSPQKNLPRKIRYSLPTLPCTHNSRPRCWGDTLQSSGDHHTNCKLPTEPLKMGKFSQASTPK